MIVHMARVRLAGPRALLDRTLAALQDLEVLHVSRPALPRTSLLPPGPDVGREMRNLPRVLGDVEAALRLLGARRSTPHPVAPRSLPAAALFAGRTRRRAERVARTITALGDERARLLRRAFEDAPRGGAGGGAAPGRTPPPPAVIEARLSELPTELAAREAELAALCDRCAPALEELRAWLHDRLLVLEARGQAHQGRHLFVLEGWAPAPEIPALCARVTRALGAEVGVSVVAREAWSRADAPIALVNPPLFRPFERLTRALPLPRFGSIDPTPFAAVFFPMLFGLLLGDVGYGAALAILALVLRLTSAPRARARSIAAGAGACAAFAILFGLLFGELFGDLGQRALHLHPRFHRGEAIVPFLALAAGLGAAHALLGLVLAVVNAGRVGHRREALARGVAAAMIALIVPLLLAALWALPLPLFTPLAVALLIALPLLILLEGIVAVVELASKLGQVLAYARILPLGTASVALALAADQLSGALGSALVGALFALLFHLVNFAIGLFSPTIHALRLHYVELFGRFFSPGGAAYRPLTHWHPSEPTTHVG